MNTHAIIVRKGLYALTNGDPSFVRLDVEWADVEAAIESAGWCGCALPPVGRRTRPIPCVVVPIDAYPNGLPTEANEYVGVEE